MFTVENIIPTSLFSLGNNADVHLHEGASTDGLPAKSPITIIQDDQTVYAHFVWSQNGWLANMLSPACTYEARIYIEQIGQGEVANPTPVKVNFTPGPGQSYSSVVPISGLQEGVYKFVGTLLLRGPNGAPTPIAAFKEINLVQVYKDN